MIRFNLSDMDRQTYPLWVSIDRAKLTHFGYVQIDATYPIWVLNLPRMGKRTKNNRNNSIRITGVTVDFFKNREKRND